MTSATFTRTDSADYLRTEADIAAYLDTSPHDGHPALVAAALGLRLIFLPAAPAA